ncbi:MAG: hypothetical protein HYX52_00295 [Chloroflexi bacterium]|nr:hypothetical protein [Chloroflexota bacterium]
MATVEVEGPDSGWVATLGYDEMGALTVLEVRDGWEYEARDLLARLILEPAPSGRIPGAHIRPNAEEPLYDLAESLARRKPEVRGQRLTGHVEGGSRAVESGDD